MPTPQRVLPPSSTKIPPVYARQLRMLLLQMAQDGDKALAAAQLDWATLLTDQRGLPHETVMQLVTAAMAITQKPWLGLDLAASLPITAHGPQGYAMVTAPDLAGSLAVLAKYGSLRNEVVAWSLKTTAQGAVVEAASHTDWGPATGFIMDTVLGSLLRMFEAALGHLPAGLIADMPLPAPRWAAQYERFFPVQVHFGKPVLAFHLSHAMLALPCLGADKHAHDTALKACDMSMDQSSSRRLSDRVSGLLSATPAGRYPQLEEVAQACDLTPRTLMRHLKAEGTSFKLLLDKSRQSQALWLLQRTDLTVEEVAAQLGYEDTSNFSRTVRRWFGTTPRQLRETQDTAGENA